MEFYLTRAHDIARLSSPQIESLHSWEQVEMMGLKHRPVRCLFPHEIAEMFGLCSLRDHFQIPDEDTFQASHSQRIRSRLQELNLTPMRVLSPLDVHEAHLFDEALKIASEEMKIDFLFQGRSPGRRLKDRLSEVA